MSITDCPGRHQTSITSLLAKAKSLSPSSIPARKKGSGQPANINKHVLKIVERFVRKPHRATTSNMRENVQEVAAVGLRQIQKLFVDKTKAALQSGCTQASPDHEDEAQEVGFSYEALTLE